ncbi:MAG: hydantoinase/oxoprolinase family protein [Pseudomonadota bacterium]
MSFSLGLDTGGTYTDAVIFDDERGIVIAKAKALTTRHELSIGIAGAAGKVMAQSGIQPADIAMVSISTTLATNALVEGQGGRAALVMIGFDESDLGRGGLKEALGNDPVIFLPGGHDVHGKPKPLDLSTLENQLDELYQNVSAFAVAGYFAVRNPEHEIAVRDLVLAKTDRPVTCSHELSSKLDGPRRALTTLLNARLIDMIARLIHATRDFLSDQKIDAPLMVVRGDGSLVSEHFALQRPIETILSGPAASLVGAHFLTDIDDAIVSDIGGTTTDIAILQDGQPRIDAAGATVGGYRTMVDAVAMRTFGLGGDSEVAIDEGALDLKINLGPRRLVPVSLLATAHREVVMSALRRQLDTHTPGRLDGRFALGTGMPDHLSSGLSNSQAALFARITQAPQPLDRLLKSTAELATLNALAARGLVLIAGITPSDAQHVIGHFSHWDAEAAKCAIELFGRKKDGNGRAIAKDPDKLASDIVTRLKKLSAERVLESVLCEDGLDGSALVQSPLIERALNRTQAMARMALFLDRPLIGLGAGASAYYPDAADILGVECQVPNDADVANAIGAVVGQVRVAVNAEIVLTESQHFEITGTELQLVKNSFMSEDDAIAAAKAACSNAVEQKAKEAGASDATTQVHEDIKYYTQDDQRVFLSATITAIASGRPAIT